MVSVDNYISSPFADPSTVYTPTVKFLLASFSNKTTWMEASDASVSSIDNWSTSNPTTTTEHESKKYSLFKLAITLLHWETG